MKKTYSLYAIGVALVLASGVLLTHPPTTARAATCDATCQYGVTSMFLAVLAHAQTTTDALGLKAESLIVRNVPRRTMTTGSSTSVGTD